MLRDPILHSCTNHEVFQKSRKHHYVIVRKQLLFFALQMRNHSGGMDWNPTSFEAKVLATAASI
jgi:hypothetical protein